jgi:hypothetical protein
VALQLAEVVGGIGARQFARVDQAHEQVAYLRAGRQARVVLSLRGIRGSAQAGS